MGGIHTVPRVRTICGCEPTHAATASLWQGQVLGGVRWQPPEPQQAELARWMGLKVLVMEAVVVAVVRNSLMARGVWQGSRWPDTTC